MKTVYSAQYIDGLIDSHTYEDMVMLASHYEAAARPLDGPPLQIPDPIFAFLEVMLWIAQLERSGGWTYFESTPVWRQEALLEALGRLKAESLVTRYGFSMQHWRDEYALDQVDRWIVDNFRVVESWLVDLVESSRDSFKQILCEPV